MDMVDIEFDFSLVFEFENNNNDSLDLPPLALHRSPVVLQGKQPYCYCRYWHY